MIQVNVGKGCNTKKYGGKMGKALLEILKIDPAGPVAKIRSQLDVNPSLHPQHLAEAMRREAKLGNGRYYEKDAWWWKPKKRRVNWFDNVFYVTKEGDLLLGWVRHRRCDSYRLFILLSDESSEIFFSKLYRWQYVPTNTIWTDLTSKDVIEHLEW